MNTNLLFAMALTVHVLCAAAWVGGMATMHWAVRPAAASLEPPQRLALLAAVLGRFLSVVSPAVLLLLVSGFAMVALRGGFGSASLSVHLMMGLGLLMAALYGHVRFAAWPRLQRAVHARDAAAGATALLRFRRIVAFNLMLGVAVFVIALIGPALSTPG